MKKFFLISTLLLIAATASLAQDARYVNIKHAYESFEYEKVISLSDSLAENKSLPDSLLISVNMMRAVSFYSLEDIQDVRKSFLSLLKINKNFLPDPLIYSPVIINIFNEVKSDYLKSITPEIKKDSTQTVLQPDKEFDSSLLSGSAVRNIFVPGWGQLHSGSQIKGIILTVLSTAALGSMIYSISDANKKETDYLNERNKLLIADKYNVYNKAYKLKYTMIAAYAAVWLFSQLDLYFISNENFTITSESPAKRLELSPTGTSDISFNFRIPFQ